MFFLTYILLSKYDFAKNSTFSIKLIITSAAFVLLYLCKKQQMKKLKEEVIRKDSSIRKVQYDKEWFYSVTDMQDYLKEDLTGIETVTLEVRTEFGTQKLRCATLEDVERILRKELFEDTQDSTSKKTKR